MGKDRRKDRGLTERNISEKKAERRRYKEEIQDGQLKIIDLKQEEEGICQLIQMDSTQKYDTMHG